MSNSSSKGRLAGQTAVVTGASRGIGRATALMLADEGANVAVTARTTSDLEELVAEIEGFGVEGLSVPADAREEKDVDRLQRDVYDRFGTVEILVNNAGVGKYGPFFELTADDYDWMMDTNMRSSFLCTKAFAPQMMERGTGIVVFLGSVAGLQSFRNESVYCATKHAQMAFARSLDREVRESGVKVSVIAPGGVNTEFAFGTGRTPGDDQLEEFLDPETVADAVRYAVTQPPKSRVFLVGMRPMSEEL